MHFLPIYKQVSCGDTFNLHPKVGRSTKQHIAVFIKPTPLLLLWSIYSFSLHFLMVTLHQADSLPRENISACSEGQRCKETILILGVELQSLILSATTFRGGRLTPLLCLDCTGSPVCKPNPSTSFQLLNFSSMNSLPFLLHQGTVGFFWFFYFTFLRNSFPYLKE